MHCYNGRLRQLLGDISVQYTHTTTLEAIITILTCTTVRMMYCSFSFTVNTRSLILISVASFKSYIEAVMRHDIVDQD